MKKHGLAWWLLIGWWWYLLFAWWIYLIKYLLKKYSRFGKHFLKSYTIKIEGTFAKVKEIEDWLSKNARNQWKNKKFSQKPIYEFPPVRDITSVSLKKEPSNPYDKNAIAVYIGDNHVGYIPKNLNVEISNRIKYKHSLFASIYGGSSKYLDENGDLIKNDSDYVITLYIH